MSNTFRIVSTCIFEKVQLKLFEEQNIKFTNRGIIRDAYEFYFINKSLLTHFIKRFVATDRAQSAHTV